MFLINLKVYHSSSYFDTLDQWPANESVACAKGSQLVADLFPLPFHTVVEMGGREVDIFYDVAGWRSETKVKAT